MVLCVSGFPAAHQSGGAEPEAHEKTATTATTAASGKRLYISLPLYPMPRPLPPQPSFLPTALPPAPSRTPTPSSSARPIIAVDTHALPASRVLISAAKPGNPTPTKNSISLRYQPMTMVDPTAPPPPPRKKVLDPPMTSARHKSPSGRGFRPKTSPGPRIMLEAIPNSWASASRPSDLRPNPPPPHTSKAARPSPTPPPPPPPPPTAAPVRPNIVRLRSKSADRVGTKTSVTGPRSPKRSVVVQPTPKRLSLGMVMDTAKLVNAPPTSDLSSSISVPLSKSPAAAAATNTVPIRSLPSSPNGSPCIARLPISGSHYKRELSPSPVSPVHRSTSPASLPVFGPKPLPVPPPSISRPILHLNPTVPLSPFTSSPPSLPSSWSPKSPLQNASASPTTATTTLSYISALSTYDESLYVKREKSGESPASSASHSSQQNDHGRFDKSIPDTETTAQHLPFSSSPPPSSSPIEEEDDEEEEEEEERQDRLDNLDAYDWTLEEELYDDQLFRIPITPTSTTSSNSHLNEPILEVFVDNLYCGERERSPSPITYARPEGSYDYSDEEEEEEGEDEGLNGGRRRRVRRKAGDEKEEERKRPDDDCFDCVASPAPANRKQQHNKQNDTYPPAPSAMSYHSDDSSLYFTGNRPLPSRRRRRGEQLRSYRYSFRPPVSPTSAAAATAVSSNTLAGFSSKVVRGKGRTTTTTTTTTKVLGCQRSPSPIEYARRRSLDGLYDFDLEDDVDDCGGDNNGGDVVFAQQHQQEVGGGDGGREGWWEGSSSREMMKRRTVQPRSFMHAYSKPPDVTLFSEEREQRVLEREREMMRERERGRRKERATTTTTTTTALVVPVPIVGNGNNKEQLLKEKDKFVRTRKGSRGILDELAAVAVRKTGNGNNNTTTPRTSGGSPPPSLPPLPPLPFHSKERDEKEKEKEKKRKWVWELSHKSDSSSKDKLVCGGDGFGFGSAASSGENVLVLDIGNVNSTTGGGRGNQWGGGGGNGEGYEGWNAEWPDDDDFALGGGNMRRGRKQRHSLNGLEFV